VDDTTRRQSWREAGDFFAAECLRFRQCKVVCIAKWNKYTLKRRIDILQRCLETEESNDVCKRNTCKDSRRKPKMSGKLDLCVIGVIFWVQISTHVSVIHRGRYDTTTKLAWSRRFLCCRVSTVQTMQGSMHRKVKQIYFELSNGVWTSS
jgi:hypothetical protein